MNLPSLSELRVNINATILINKANNETNVHINTGKVTFISKQYLNSIFWQDKYKNNYKFIITRFIFIVILSNFNSMTLD